MRSLSLNKILSVNYEDGWMRPDFILVDNKFNIKNLKPYQRMIVLRKPEGEIRCIVDKSLSNNEIHNIQNKIMSNGYIDINDKKIDRVIPHDFATVSENKVDLDDEEEYEKGLLLFETENSVNEFSDSEQNDKNLEPIYNNYIFKLNDEKVFFSNKKSDLSKKNTQNKSGVSDVDLIDSIVIKIPHEEKLINWNSPDDVSDIIKKIDPNYQEVEEVNVNQNQDVQYEDMNQYEQQIYDLEQKNKEIEEQYYSDVLNNGEVQNYDEQMYVDDSYYEQQELEQNENEFNQQDELQLNQLDQQEEIVDYSEQNDENYIVDGETDYNDYNNTTYEEETNDVEYSFFKNQTNEQYWPRQKSYINFYDDNSKSSNFKKVYLNKKLNMYTFKRKIDKKLLKNKNKKR